MTRARWLAVVVVVVAALAYTFRPRPPAPEPTAASGAVPSVSLYTVHVGTFVQRVHAFGRVGPPAGSETRLAFAAAGIVSAVDVHVGEAVGAGQTLARIDLGADAAYALSGARARVAAAQRRVEDLEHGSASAQSDVAAANAALAQSRAKVAADQRNLQREQTLFAAGVAARKDVDDANAALAYDRADASADVTRARAASAGVGTALSQARADVVQAQSDARSAEHTLSYATLRAPTSGVVSAILKHVGEGIDPTQPAIVLSAPAGGEATLSVDADVAATVAPGDPVLLTIPLRDAHAEGVVRSIVPSVDPATQTTTVTVSGAPPGARPGDALTATIAPASGHRTGVLIPTQAIVQDPESGATIVFVRQSGKGGTAFVARKVGVGPGDEAQTVVTSGLRPGERIAVQGAYDLLAPAGG